MSEHDNTNRGALFPTGDMTLIRCGQAHFGEIEQRLAVIKVITKSGKTVFEVYQKIGAVFANTEKKTEKSPDMSGTVTYEGLEWKMAGWKEESKQGLQYTSIALTPPEVEDPPDDQAPATGGGGDIDDSDIPF